MRAAPRPVLARLADRHATSSAALVSRSATISRSLSQPFSHAAKMSLVEDMAEDVAVPAHDAPLPVTNSAGALGEAEACIRNDQ
jgi:hypothetical protein